eukprot:2912568-Amphidinium_carterae.1
MGAQKLEAEDHKEHSVTLCYQLATNTNPSMNNVATLPLNSLPLNTPQRTQYASTIGQLTVGSQKGNLDTINNFTKVTNSMIVDTGAVVSVAPLGFVPNIPMIKDHGDS